MKTRIELAQQLLAQASQLERIAAELQLQNKEIEQIEPLLGVSKENIAAIVKASSSISGSVGELLNQDYTHLSWADYCAKCDMASLMKLGEKVQKIALEVVRQYKPFTNPHVNYKFIGALRFDLIFNYNKDMLKKLRSDVEEAIICACGTFGLDGDFKKWENR